jgi:hypothetical protein
VSPAEGYELQGSVVGAQSPNSDPSSSSRPPATSHPSASWGSTAEQADGYFPPNPLGAFSPQPPTSQDHTQSPQSPPAISQHHPANQDSPPALSPRPTRRRYPSNEGLQLTDEQLNEQIRQLNAILAGRGQSLVVQPRPESGDERRKFLKAKRRLYIISGIAGVAFVAIVVALGVTLGKNSNSGRVAPPAPNPTSTLTRILPYTTSPYAEVPPVTNWLAVTAVVLGNTFNSSSPPSPKTMLAYQGGNGKICVRAKSDSWSNNVQCIEGANSLPDSPLTFLDWVGGPSIYYFNNQHILSGINLIPNPQRDAWQSSTIVNSNLTVHNQSQIASFAWHNGKSPWVYFQDPSGQIREWGLDDYRGSEWRKGSHEPHGEAPAGSGIGVTYWLNGTEEVEELYFQEDSGALTGKTYVGGDWKPGLYAVDGTLDNIDIGTSFSVMTVTESSGLTLLLAYMGKSGYLTVQARGTKDIPIEKLGAFSQGVKVVEGDGQSKVGIGIVGSFESPFVYVSNAKKFLELSARGSGEKNWTANPI